MLINQLYVFIISYKIALGNNYLTIWFICIIIGLQLKNKEGLNGYRKANKSIRIDTGSYRDYSTGSK